jgi:hypothetical protein
MAVPEMPEDGGVSCRNDGNEDIRNRRLKTLLPKLAQDATDLQPVRVFLGKLNLSPKGLANPPLVGSRRPPENLADHRPADRRPIRGDGLSETRLQESNRSLRPLRIEF